mmetsp:Transcript_62508/g.104024  ORF Transcript_62508/g.104024 Transcript_62508/m.104024 type:complete len:370 (+) Transcript_62508:109-1218(+)|eukprot:CAMPEP_0119313000 /NCGR_PEP_ID=MMETSP1333-20130426/27506_1 /TAXON_ID=418940 /ORGANISM="Scyphosphaera apsteinii, Strain RCC1455" /LENGTH=369 /DNA_ID=CAMNT_0007317715 /DNA_START=106 /DNA_END=1215 /DNA_ORIENTATION=+
MSWVRAACAVVVAIAVRLFIEHTSNAWLSQPPSSPITHRSELIEEVQPDLVRLRTPVLPEVMRCGMRIPPESVAVTVDGTASVEIFARSVYNGIMEGEHSWTLHVEVTNTGTESVQLMTRHIVLTSGKGRVEEVKGPGVGGRLPVTEPGEKFAASSNILLPTTNGAVHGSYQFEYKTSTKGSTFASFAANIGRLALSSSGRSENVVCGQEANLLARELPATSVYNSYRVLVGAIAHCAHGLSDEDLNTFVFVYEVQIHNERNAAVVFLAHEWTFLDARGVVRSEDGVGLGGNRELGRIRLPSGRGLVYRGNFTLPTSTGVAAGRLIALFDEDDEDDVTYEIVIAPMGVSVDGDVVPPIEHLSFLSALST